MKFLFVHSHKFKYDKYGNVYSEGQFPYELIKKRYLPYCREVFIAGRAEKVKDQQRLSKSSGPNIYHYKMPDLSTIKNRYIRSRKLKSKLLKLIKKVDLVIARMPSIHARYAIKIAKKLNKPYVVEVVGDVFISLWTHGNIFGKLLAPFEYYRSRKIIKKSPYTIYVTKKYLQKRYPPKHNGVTIHASNVEMQMPDKESLHKRILRIQNMSKESMFKIGLIGSYSSKYKGIDTAIKSIKQLKTKGINCKLLVLGSGNNDWLKKIAKSLNVENNIEFVGVLPGGKAVLNWLD